jgi:hypothetical protein
MKPYFLTHPIGILYFAVVLGWYFMELVQFARQQQWRSESAPVGPRSFWFAFAACVAGAIVALSVAPHAAPGAAIGHGALVFGIGIGIRWPGRRCACGRSSRWAGTSPSPSR